MWDKHVTLLEMIQEEHKQKRLVRYVRGRPNSWEQSERRQRAIDRAWDMEYLHQTMTLEEIGYKYGITRERVRQILLILK